MSFWQRTKISLKTLLFDGYSYKITSHSYNSNQIIVIFTSVIVKWYSWIMQFLEFSISYYFWNKIAFQKNFFKCTHTWHVNSICNFYRLVMRKNEWQITTENKNGDYAYHWKALLIFGNIFFFWQHHNSIFSLKI